MWRKCNALLKLCLVLTLILSSLSPCSAVIAGSGATNITSCGTFGAGSFVVVNNITSSGIQCLVFNAGPVTLDLAGFTVSGSGFTNGVLALSVNNVTVRNGSIKGFARAVGITGGFATVQGVQALNGTVDGILVGDNSTVEDSSVIGHADGGIKAGKHAAIYRNTLIGNNGNEITVSDGSIVEENRITLGGKASSGFSPVGISVTSHCVVSKNIISGSGEGFGVSGSEHNLITGNLIDHTIEGIQILNNAIATSNNIIAVGDNAIETGADSVISGNDASDNGGDGIIGGPGTQFANNVANNNFLGIQVVGGGFALEDSANGNGTNGFDVTCPAKIDDNIATGNVSKNLGVSGTGCGLANNLAP
jgi:parallel beta-helix repeat protein